MRFGGATITSYPTTRVGKRRTGGFDNVTIGKVKKITLGYMSVRATYVRARSH